MTDRLVIVPGMHRSGTSAITRGLKVLGVDLGQSFIPNYDDNIKGFWEDADFQAVNVRMLQALGHDWHTLGLFTDDSLPGRLSGFRLEALDLLKRKLESTTILGVKDPRFSRLLPFWKELFTTVGIHVSYVIPLRNPISVALSLQKRNGFEFEKSFYLWQQHMLLSMLGVDSETSVVVDFDRVLADPGAQLTRIGDYLGLSVLSEEAMQEYVNDFLDRKLRHTEYTLDDLQAESRVPAGVVDTFRLLSGLANDEPSVQKHDQGAFFVGQWQRLKDFGPLFQSFDRRETALLASEQRCGELSGELEQRVGDIRKQTQTLTQLRETIDKQRLTIETHKEQLVNQKNNYEKVVAEHQEVIAEHQEVIDGYTKRESSHESLKIQLENKIAAYLREIGRLQSDIKEKNTRLIDREEKLTALTRELKLVEDRYNKLLLMPELRAGTQLRSLVHLGKRGISKRRSGDVSREVLKLVRSSGVFDEAWYRSGFSPDQQPDNLLEHYLSSGWKEGRTPSVLFDDKWYLEQYPDVKAADICPLRHYLSQGWKECRQPHPAFDSAWYLTFYEDIREAGISPLQHYVRFGAREGRKPNKVFDVNWFVKKYAEKISHIDTKGALASYLIANQKNVGAVEHNPLFSSDEYSVKNPESTLNDESTLAHFLPRAHQFVREMMTRSKLDEGISKDFDQAAAALFCSGVRRAKFNGSNEVEAPLVSIIMPTHNRRDKICAAIDSVLQQSYDNWELLIVDDGSEDDTFQWVRDNYSDSRVSIRSTEACGVCHARNVALKNATGELIAYLDSDNTWVSDFLELMVAYLHHEGADFAYAAIRMQNESGTSYRYREFSHTDLLIKNFIDLNAILHKRKLYEQLGGFNEALFRMVDWDLIIRYTKSIQVVSAPFIGVNYDNHKQPDRITVREPKSWRYAIMNHHLIDWDQLASEIHLRDKELVSIVIPVYGQLDLTRKCMASLLQVPSGRPFEIILVDNGSDYDDLEELFMWSEGNANVSLIRNLENLNFALGCNLGFASARGRQVVFLNNDTEVTAGWLDKLLKPLKGNVGAVQPKLVYPDGRIQCAGIVFSERSSIGFPIYADLPANLPAVNHSRSYQAITAACMAVHGEDFTRLRGFDPLYVNGQEDVDFCLRLAELGKTCWYEASSLVIHHESKTAGRGQFIVQNRLLFDQRWSGKLQPDAEKYFQGDGYDVKGWRSDRQVLAGYQPVLSKITSDNPVTKSLTFAIKVPCPHAGIKNEWGDYHFARSLGGALRRAGHSFRIDFLDEWDKGAGTDEINLVLRGLSAFEPRPDQTNLMWMISHPNKITVTELEKYDHIFVASVSYAHELRQQLGSKVSCLLQCTDPSLFHPDENDTEYQSEVLFVGNSRNQYREVVRLAVENNCELSVYGTRWEQFISNDYIKGEGVPNHRLSHYYRNAGVVLNDHWPDMREKGFISNRIFDVLACGVPVVSDRVSDLPDDLREYVLIYDDDCSLKNRIQQACDEDLLTSQARFRLALYMHQAHSFDARVEEILLSLEGAIG